MLSSNCHSSKKNQLNHQMEEGGTTFCIVDDDFTLDVVAEDDEIELIETNPIKIEKVKEESTIKLENQSTKTLIGIEGNVKKETEIKTEAKRSETHYNKQCHLCSYKAWSPERLAAHIKMHLDPHCSLLKCKSCDYMTFSKNSLSQHMGRCTWNSKKVKCPHCNWTTLRHRNIKQHIANKHSSSRKEYSCKKCSFKTADLDKMKSHRLEEHKVTRKTKRQNQIEKTRCNCCDFETTDKIILKNHMKIHRAGKVKIFKCDLCDYESRYMSNVVRHRAKHIIAN